MREFKPDDFAGDDTKRVQNTIDAATEHYGRAYFPWTGHPYELEDTIWIRPTGNDDSCAIFIEGDPVWKLFEYHGSPRKSVFRSLGLKTSTVKNIGLRCFASDCFGFDFGGDGKTDSSSANLFENLRFQSERNTHGNTGISVGRGGDDHSGNVFSRCGVSADIQGTHQDKEFLAKVADAGHTGYSCVGGNTLGQVVRDCTGFAQKVLFKLFDHGGYKSGGAHTSFDNSAGTSCCLGYLVDGGFGVQIRGGRWELGGALLVHGDPRTGGRGQGTVLLSSVLCDAFFPVTGAKCGLFEPGEMIGLRSDAEVVIQTCEFTSSKLGEALSPTAIRIASNSGHEAVLHLQGNRGLPTPSETSEGLRRIVIDGQSKPLRIKR